MENNFVYTITSDLHDLIDEIYEELSDNNLESVKKSIELAIRALRDIRENITENENL